MTQLSHFSLIFEKHEIVLSESLQKGALSVPSHPGCLICMALNYLVMLVLTKYECRL